MSLIPISNAKPGMVLQSSAVNEKGMALLNPGTELSDALISRLQRWGVESIDIVSDSGDESEISSRSPSAGEGAAQKSTLEKKFIHVRNDPLMGAILEAIVAHREKENQEDEE